MRTEILKSLDLINKHYDARILFAVEAGSRAWKFESPDSDYDVRFVYARSTSWYLSINNRRDIIELPTNGLLDINGWDLKKALFQIQRGNPAFFEWLNTDIIYIDSQTRSDLTQLAKHHFNSRTAIYHYLHMASGNYREYLKTDTVRLKKYLYVIRPLLCCEYIQKYNSMPPVVFSQLELPTDFPKSALDELLELKRQTSELGEAPRINVLNSWIENRINHFSDLARVTARASADTDDLNEYLLTTILGNEETK